MSEGICPDFVVQGAQKREEEEKRRGNKASMSSTQNAHSENRPSANVTPATSNFLIPLPTISSTTLLQPSQVLPNATTFYPYRIPTTVPHLSPAMISPLYGPSPFELQASYGLGPPIFPANQYHPLASVTQIPCVHIPHYPWPYKNIRLPQPTPLLRTPVGVTRAIS